jgi:hypothetical protein
VSAAPGVRLGEARAAHLRLAAARRRGQDVAAALRAVEAAERDLDRADAALRHARERADMPPAVRAGP